MSLAKRPRKFHPNQGDLFQRLEQPAVIGRANAPDLQIGPELLGALNTALRHARSLGYGRERVVDRMNQALPGMHKPITLRQLNSWTAESKEYHEFPLRYLAALGWATECEEPLRVVARSLGFDLVDAREAAAKRLGEAHLEAVRARREIADLTRTLEAP